MSRTITVALAAGVAALGIAALAIDGSVAAARVMGGGGGGGGGAPHVSAMPHMNAAPHVNTFHAPSGFSGVHPHMANPGITHPHVNALHTGPTHQNLHGNELHNLATHDVHHGSKDVLAHGDKSNTKGNLKDSLNRDNLNKGNLNGQKHLADRNLSHSDLVREAKHQELVRHDFDRRFHDRDRFFDHRDFRRGFFAWAGPVFWPFVFDDFVSYVIWPYYYYDDYAYAPFWAYGYDDLFAGIFWPYDYAYSGYAYGNPAYGHHRGRRLAYNSEASPDPSSYDTAALCRQEGASFVEFPFDRMQQTLTLTPDQQQKLEAVKSASEKALDELQNACPTEAAYTPVGRLKVVEARLRATLETVETVRPPLQAFYDSLNDEQKARLDNMGASRTKTSSRGRNPVDSVEACGQSNEVASLPIDQLEKAVRPSDAQKTTLDELRQASSSAAEKIKASCPDQPPLTVSGRLEAVEKRLQAMLDAVETVRPSLEKLYASLDDEQKARFNMVGRRRPG